MNSPIYSWGVGFKKRSVSIETLIQSNFNPSLVLLGYIYIYLYTYIFFSKHINIDEKPVKFFAWNDQIKGQCSCKYTSKSQQHMKTRKGRKSHKSSYPKTRNNRYRCSSKTRTDLHLSLTDKVTWKTKNKKQKTNKKNLCTVLQVAR